MGTFSVSGKSAAAAFFLDFLIATGATSSVAVLELEM